MKVTKFSKSVNETLDSSKLYNIEEAFSMLMNFKRESFNESVDVAFNLGVDPRHAEENIRLSINLPHGIGKEVSVLAIVNADKEADAKEAGADFVGKDEFLDKIKSGWTDVDKIVVTPDLMVELGKLGKVLGPKGLMPNPKSGTVTNDVAKAIKEVGKVLDLINSLKKTGVGVIVISHRMDDIFAVCDRVMALFQGTNFAESELSNTSRDEVIGWIMGKK